MDCTTEVCGMKSVGGIVPPVGNGWMIGGRLSSLGNSSTASESDSRGRYAQLQLNSRDLFFVSGVLLSIFTLLLPSSSVILSYLILAVHHEQVFSRTLFLQPF